MKFKNYCVIIMGNTDGVFKEIEKISDTKPNILDAKGIVIATFTTFVDVKEISAWFSLNNRSFLVFELNPDSSGFLITKKEVHEGLFGFLGQITEEHLDSKTFEFLKAMTSPDQPIKNKKTEDIQDAVIVEEEKEKQINETDIEKMTKNEKDDLMNQLMDNGIENLTENDKKILPLLAK